jgi:hypothetical protein
MEIMENTGIDECPIMYWHRSIPIYSGLVRVLANEPFLGSSGNKVRAFELGFLLGSSCRVRLRGYVANSVAEVELSRIAH